MVVAVGHAGCMSRRKLIWHIGLPDAVRAVVGASLEANAPALDSAGVQVVATAEEGRLATHELLRTHQQAGLSRREVEGGWARICDRVWQHKGVSVLSTPDLCIADKDQLDLALNPLIGVEVHLVVTLASFSEQLYGAWLGELRAGRSPGWENYLDRVLAPAPSHRQADRFWAGHDVPGVLSRWGWTFHPDRLHVIAEPDPAGQWADFAALVKKGIDLIGSFPHGFAAPFVWGIVASAITGFIAVWGTIRFLRTHTFTPFVIYRVVAGTAVILISVTSLR